MSSPLATEAMPPTRESDALQRRQYDAPRRRSEPNRGRPGIQLLAGDTPLQLMTIGERVRAGIAALPYFAEPVQRQASGASVDSVHAHAAEGVSGSGGQLPYLDQIQASFGAHDVSGVSAHVGGKARDASEAIGARAYATGNSVAFASTPTLHTAAHEAAHIVQQRGGVQLEGGVGAAGDRYEQHADAVADLVVQGKSAESLLDKMAGPSANSTGVQRSLVQRDDAPQDDQGFVGPLDESEDAAMGQWEVCVNTDPELAAKIRAYYPPETSYVVLVQAFEEAMNAGRSGEDEYEEATPAPAHDPHLLSFRFGGQNYNMPWADFIDFYHQRIAPAAAAVGNQGRNVAGQASDLVQNNEDHWLASPIVHLFSGAEARHPQDIATLVSADMHRLLHDIRAHGLAREAAQCTAKLAEAVESVNWGHRFLAAYRAKLEEGAKTTEKVIKITAAGVVIIASAGAAAPVGLAEAGGMAAAGASAQELTTIVATGLDPKQSLSWEDFRKAALAISAKTLGAMVGARFAAPLAKHLAAATGGMTSKALEESVEAFLSTSVEEVANAVATATSMSDFQAKLLFALKKAGLAALPGEAGAIAPEVIDGP